MRNYNDLDGEVIDYQVLGGGAELRSNYREEFFADANGCSAIDNECPGNYSNAFGDKYATFMNLPSFKNADGEYSNAGGLFKGTVLDKKERARRRGRREARQDERQARRTERTMSTAEARRVKAGAKATTAEGQKLAAESLGKESQSDIALAKAISSNPSEKKGLSTGAIVGIVIGSLALIGTVAYFVIKSKNSAKK